MDMFFPQTIVPSWHQTKNTYIMFL